MNIFISKHAWVKANIRWIQIVSNTITVQVETPSLETSKFSLYFSGSCIPANPKVSYIFPPEFLVVFNRLQCKKIKYSTRNSKYFVYIFQQLPSMRRTHSSNVLYLPLANHRPESIRFLQSYAHHKPANGHTRGTRLDLNSPNHGLDMQSGLN
jgi:hypothetical protein